MKNKLTIAIVAIFMIVVSLYNCNAANVTLDDIKWSLSATKGNIEALENKEKILEHIERRLNSSSEVKEYTKRCNTTAGALATSTFNEIIKILEQSSEGDDLKLKNILANTNDSHYAKKILLDLLIYKYDLLFDSEEGGSSEEVTKAQFEEFIKDYSSDEKKKLQKAFAQIYHVQTNVEIFQNVIKDAKKDDDNWQYYDTAGEWDYTYKMEEVFYLISEAKKLNGGKSITMDNALEYSKIPDTGSINTSTSYSKVDNIYMWFFVKDDEVEDYTEYIKTINALLKEENKICMDVNVSNNSCKASVSTTIEIENTNGDSMWDGPIQIIQNVPLNLKKGTGYESTYGTGSNSPVWGNKEVITNILRGTLDLSSLFAAYGTSYAGKKLDISQKESGAFSDGMNDINSLIRMAGQEYAFSYFFASPYPDLYSNKQVYFIDLEGTKGIKNVNNFQVEITLSSGKNALEVFKGLYDREYDYNLIAIYGYYDSKDKSFTLGHSNSEVYYIYYMFDDIYLLKDKEVKRLNNPLGFLFLNVGEGMEEFCEVNSVKKIVKVGHQNGEQIVNFTVPNAGTDATGTFKSNYNIRKFVSEMKEWLTITKDVTVKYKESISGLSSTLALINETLNIVDENVDYASETQFQATNKYQALGATDYSSLQLCPDWTGAGATCDEGWWACAFNFLQTGQKDENNMTGVLGGVTAAVDGIGDMIFDIGNMIFIVVISMLGVKYIWGGANTKFEIKNSLITVVVAAIVFYGWNAVADILQIKELLTGPEGSDYHGLAYTVYNTILYIVNVLSVGGIIYIGIKYMMAGADGKAEMKVKLVPVIMGIIMVYGTLNLINFILKIAGVI